MIPRTFEYLSPSTVKETVSLLKKYGSNGKVLAGGMSLVPVMKLRLASPTHIIDINRVQGLDYIKENSGRLLVGALTKHYALETSKLVKQKARLLAETASWIGDPQVRNMGTIGGSLSHCDPSGDWGAAILAMRGEVRVTGPTKERTIPIDDFLVDTFTSALRPNELLTEVRIPLPKGRSGGAYTKLERKAGDFATVAVAAQVSIDPKGVCTYAGIGLTALGPRNIRAARAEKALLGKPLTQENVDAASRAASEDAEPIGDPLRGSAEYKREMAGVYTKRALNLALARAKGGE